MLGASLLNFTKDDSSASGSAPDAPTLEHRRRWMMGRLCFFDSRIKNQEDGKANVEEQDFHSFSQQQSITNDDSDLFSTLIPPSLNLSMVVRNHPSKVKFVIQQKGKWTHTLHPSNEASSEKLSNPNSLRHRFSALFSSELTNRHNLCRPFSPPQD
ncbi:hypothetical protein NL676_018428 [Syzygium grande]|nr:hypothetical protein NL676_018428 [Syzygium grande]